MITLIRFPTLKRYFNSKKVRLRHLFLTSSISENVFQFQKGAIKTLDASKAKIDAYKFQFQKGAIKTKQEHNSLDIATEFQFQKGAIKTGNSSTLRTCLPISIPKRCD